MKPIWLCLAVAATGLSIAPLMADPPTADAVLAELKAGNAHHAAKQYAHPHQTSTRQRELRSEQHPHAAVLSCADSRVPPEIVFDQGLGDLFCVRVAGNVAGDDELASLEYAAEHLEVPLIVVLGHQNCGAITAALEGGDAPGHLPALMTAIAPALPLAKNLPGDRLANTVRANVEQTVRRVRDSQPVLAERVAGGHLRVEGAVYSLDTGRVEWLSSSAASSR